MNHSAIATLALKFMPAAVEQKDWWVQSTAVTFEQHAGLRVPGQTSTDDFQLSTTRTVPGDKVQPLKAWLETVNLRAEFGGVPIGGEASTSSTDRWRYWRVSLTHETRVVVNISDKSDGKSSLTLQHSKLNSVDDIIYWHPIWKDLLAQL